MPIDWDALVLAPAMRVFGEGDPTDQSTWPIYKPKGLPPFPLADAVFDSAYLHTSVGPDAEPTTSRRPVLGVRLALFPRAPAQYDEVQIVAGPGIGTYVITDPETDGHGHALLVMMGPKA